MIFKQLVNEPIIFEGTESDCEKEIKRLTEIERNQDFVKALKEKDQIIEEKKQKIEAQKRLDLEAAKAACEREITANRLEDLILSLEIQINEQKIKVRAEKDKLDTLKGDLHVSKLKLKDLR